MSKLIQTELVQARLFQERMASLKVGVVSGGVTGLIATGLLLLPIPDRLLGQPVWQIAMGLAIVGFSGFLFGITYRHIIRHDDNSHLKSGAVGAFGLT